MRILKKLLLRVLRGIGHMSFRLITLAAIGIAIWLTVISPSTHDKAEELINRGREIYDETNGDETDIHYWVREDSLATYIYVK